MGVRTDWTVSRKQSARTQRVGTAQELAQLRAAIGSDGFYALVAKIDRAHASKWRSMVDVQARFKAAEPDYHLAASRTYSESNRDTLHRAVIKLLERNPVANVFDAFIGLHLALFRENGAYRLPTDQQLAILSHVHPIMLAVSLETLATDPTLFVESRWRSLVHTAAEETRAARRAQGMPVTRPGN